MNNKNLLKIMADNRSFNYVFVKLVQRDPVTKEPADETSRIQQECFKKGLLLIGAGILGNVIRLLIPLNISDEQLEQVLLS